MNRLRLKRIRARRQSAPAAIEGGAIAPAGGFVQKRIGSQWVLFDDRGDLLKSKGGPPWRINGATVPKAEEH